MLRSYLNTYLLPLLLLINSCVIFASSDQNFLNLPAIYKTSFTPDILGPDTKFCALCHTSQFQDWENSLHAQSFQEGLVGQLPLFDKDTQLFCLDCHLPRSDQQAKLLENIITVDFSEQHGVDCASCHLRDNIRYGAKTVSNTPHGTVVEDKLFKQSSFCSSCHQFDESGLSVNGKPLENTYQEWKASRYAKQGVTCQNCHMPDKRHLFKGIHDADMVRSGITITAKKIPNDLLEIILENTGTGHAFPTYITPRVRVEWRGEDGSHKRLITIQRKMSWNEVSGWKELYDTRLLPNEKRKVVVGLNSNLKGKVEVWVDPDEDYYQRIYPVILEALLKDKHKKPVKAAIKHINKAIKRTKNSSYLLLTLYCESSKKFICN